MPQYIIVYKGEATDMADMSQEEMMSVMQKWEEWMTGVGSALADIGAPFGPSSSLVDDGSDGTAAPLTGYSILQVCIRYTRQLAAHSLVSRTSIFPLPIVDFRGLTYPLR